MPTRNPCPHCPDLFFSDQVLQTHIHFIHNDGASQPPRSKPLVWTPPMTNTGANAGASLAVPVAPLSREDRIRLGITSSSTAAAKAEGGRRVSDVSSLRRTQTLREGSGFSAQPGLNFLNTEVWPSGCPRAVQVHPINDASIPKKSPTPPPGSRPPPFRDMTHSVDNPIAVRGRVRPAERPAWRSETARRRSASPVRFGIPVNPQARNFVVLYECQEARVEQRLEVPTTTPWQSFTALLGGASAPVAEAYIAGRTTGFTLEDGPWRYAFVNQRGVREDRWRILTSNLLYQAMISELMTYSVLWTHVLVCHVRSAAPQGDDGV